MKMYGNRIFTVVFLVCLMSFGTVLPVCADAPRTTYEIFVGSFYDSDGNGTGDIAGVTEKLDYISGEEGMGFDGIWLTPVFPSPTYHKYDVTDYLSVDPAFGTLEDLDELIRSCHERGVKLILDLPVNHTSAEHPWFLEAAEYLAEHPERDASGQSVPSPEEDSGTADSLPYTAEEGSADILESDDGICRFVDYYNFTTEPGDGYAPLGDSGWYYEARFWEGMPDLNLDSEDVREEIRKIVGFWLERGVDGFRLDAVTYYYAGQNSKNTEFLSWLTDTVRSFNPEAYIVGEAWTDQNTYSSFYAGGIDSLFDFAFAGEDGIIAQVVRGTRSASVYAEALQAEEELYASVSPDYINAPFYTNHDMARSAGYYAWDDGSRTKLSAALNLLMPGNAFVYYGEELGMKGSGKDENKRAPMYWSADPETEGMCDAPPGMDSVSMKFGSLEEQEGDPLSVWNYFREAIRIRSAYPAISHGKTTYVEELSGEDVCAFERTYGEEKLLILLSTAEERREADLSGTPYAQYGLKDALDVSSEKTTEKDGVVSVAPFGVAVLQ